MTNEVFFAQHLNFSIQSKSYRIDLQHVGTPSSSLSTSGMRRLERQKPYKFLHILDPTETLSIPHPRPRPRCLAATAPASSSRLPLPWSAIRPTTVTPCLSVLLQVRLKRCSILRHDCIKSKNINEQDTFQNSNNLR